MMRKMIMMKSVNSFDGKWSFLSNFYDSPIHQEHNGEIIDYPTVEHAFQACKTKNWELRKEIAAAATPGRAKRAGRKLFLREDWEDIKIDVMASLIKGKFQWANLREKLLSTGDAYLEEGNTWHDNFWGNCHCEKCKDIQGQNNLGKILMAERDRIRKSGGQDELYYA